MPSGNSELFFFPTEKIANKICGCCCTGASIPFLSEIHVDRLYNQTQNALFSFSITAKIKLCFVSGPLICPLCPSLYFCFLFSLPCIDIETIAHILSFFFPFFFSWIRFTDT
ncbi:hypothetical protein Peur_071882 [Populus x canadensis]